MRRDYPVLSLIYLFLLAILSDNIHAADLNNNQVINHEIARRIEVLKKNSGYSSQDFNACQITWTIRALEKTDPPSQFQPHEVTFQYENQQIIKLVNLQDGEAESIQGLGLNCLEFNDHVYLFFDTLNYETRSKFNLTDLSYVIYSADKGASWSELQSLHSFSVKDKFVLPHDRFQKYVKIFGNDENHALTIFNLRDETTYLFDPEFNILKTVPVYNRLSDFDYPVDFYAHENILYLVRGSCEKVKERIRCPARTYMETSSDFGHSWEKETLPLIKKSYLFTINGSLYQFYFKSCPTNWFGLVSALNRSLVCGYVQVKKLDADGKWGKPKTLIKTVDKLFGMYEDTNLILVWQDFRFHKSRPCGFIPLIGCVDATPFRGPTVVYAGELDATDWHIDESIIKYEN